MPIYMRIENVSLNFTRVGDPFSIKLHQPDVQGFTATAEPTQADVDAVTETLEQVYAGMPTGQQAVLAMLLTQASRAEA